MTYRSQHNRTHRTGIVHLLVMLVMAAALSGCSNDPSSSSPFERSEWEGELKFVFVERAIVVPYFLTDSGALLLRPSADTEFVDIGPLTEGVGINFANRMFHSEGIYRIRGEVSEDPADEVQLLSIPTRIVDVASIALVKEGEGDCTAHFGTMVPARSNGSGFVPLFPDYVEGKTGIFVHDGRASCTIVSRGGEPMSSITSVGSMDLNREVDWARPSVEQAAELESAEGS